MGHRSIVLLLSAFFACASSNLMALGLGKIKLDSSLNQPLVAEIELFEVRELQKEEIRVAIATREDFERIGVDKVYFLSDLTFDVVVNGSASYIKLTSEKAVREPFLNFVVQVQWPSGKLLREYTLLMDLPAFSDVQAPPVQSASGTPAEPSQQYSAPSEPAQSSTYSPRSEYTEAPARPSSRPVSPSYTGDSYTVRANDTLWEIATSVRPDGSVSIHQTMIAIQRSNPEAFINSNINLLKKGQILRIPDREEMSSLRQREAVREVADQNSAWSGGSSSGEVSDAQLSGTNAYDDYEAENTAQEGRLKLASPDDSFESSEGRSGGGTAAEVSTEALENELAIALEQLDKSGRDNADLKSKVDSLQEQMSTMELMIEAKNREMEALQASIQKSEEAAAALAEQVESQSESANLEGAIDEVADTLAESTDSALETAGSGIGSVESDLDSGEVGGSSIEELYGTDSSSDAEIIEGGVDIAEPAEVAEVQVSPAPEAQDAANRNKVVSAPTVPEEKSIIQIILDNVLYIAGGVVALAAGAFFLMRKKSSDEEDFDEFLNQQGLEQEPPESEMPMEDAFEEDIDLGDFSEESDEEISAEPLEEEVDLDSESEAQTEDVVAEADIYIAYGKFDQAEEMLLKSLASDPSDHDVRLKLLEVYSTQGDAESFDPHFAKLREFAPPTSIERAETLRSNIPNVADFDEGGFDVSDVTQIKPREAVLDNRGPVEATTDELDLPSDDDLSLDLDLGDLDDSNDKPSFDLELPNEIDTGALNVSSDEEADSLDLDLDFDLPTTDDDSSFDLELDLPEDDSDGINFEIEEPKSSEDDLSLDLDDISLDSELESEDLGGSAVDYSGDDLDLDLSLDSSNASSLEADLASLDAELDLSVNFDAKTAQTDSADIADDEIDLSALSKSTGSLDFSGTVSSDTVVNDALNDEYIEQKLSEGPDAELNLDESLPLEDLEDSLPDFAEDDEADLDLSSLDEELDALTSSVSADEPASLMDEPVTDFDDFEDELEKDEAMAETVKSGHVTSEDVEGMGEETMFNQAISEVPPADDSALEFELPEIDPNDVGDDDLEFLSDSDETATKLDLARAYIDMGDQEGARDIIREVMGEGNDQQKSEAEGLLTRIDG